MKKLLVLIFAVLLTSSAHTQTTMTTATLADALNKLVPVGWELFVRNEVFEKRIVGWKSTPDWQDALAQIAANHNLDIRVNTTLKKVFVDPKSSVDGLGLAQPNIEVIKVVQPVGVLASPVTLIVQAAPPPVTSRRFTADLVKELKPGNPMPTPPVEINIVSQPVVVTPLQTNVVMVMPPVDSPIIAATKPDTSMVIIPMPIKDVFEQVVRKHGYTPDWQVNDKEEPYRTSHNIKVLGDTLEADLIQLQKSFGAGKDSPFLLDVANGNKVVIITERK